MIDYIELRNYVESNKNKYTNETYKYIKDVINRSEYENNIVKLNALASRLKECEE